jgi:hypothetical protein
MVGEPAISIGLNIPADRSFRGRCGHAYAARDHLFRGNEMMTEHAIRLGLKLARKDE